MAMKRYLLFVSYFGNRYRGIQKQNFNGELTYEDKHTICGILEIALKKMCYPSNHPVVIPSSRTDKGVHAICNTVHVDLQETVGSKFSISCKSIAITLNKFFQHNDHDIRILDVLRVSNDFHCRYKAVQRQYLYRLAVPKTNVPYRLQAFVPSPLTDYGRCFFLKNPGFDAEAVKAACNIFVGTKDFKAVSSKDKSRLEKTTVRHIYSLNLESASPLLPSKQLSEEYDFWHFHCTGKSFLYHQVRRMVSALTLYGQGSVSLSDVQRLVDVPDEKSWDPFHLLLPPYGLFLLDVKYLPEDLMYNTPQVYATRLENKISEIRNSLKECKGSIFEKIELRQKLLDLQTELSTIKQSVAHQ